MLAPLIAAVEALIRKYTRAKYAAWTIVMMARKAERIENMMLMVVSGGRLRDV